MTEGTQARPERVMVLEPDAERRQMLAQTLMQSGFRCFMADSVHDALPFYQDRQDSACMLTILNARLPWCESVELLSRAQENDWPVLFLTAEAANVAHLQSLFDLPCDALVHPFSPQAADERGGKLAAACPIAPACRAAAAGHAAPPRDDGRRTLDAHRAGICPAGSAGENAGGSRLPRNAPADGVGVSGFRRNTHGGRAHSAFAAEIG